MKYFYVIYILNLCTSFIVYTSNKMSFTYYLYFLRYVVARSCNAVQNPHHTQLILQLWNVTDINYVH
jgi:hypothetical protein